MLSDRIFPRTSAAFCILSRVTWTSRAKARFSTVPLLMVPGLDGGVAQRLTQRDHTLTADAGRQQRVFRPRSPSFVVSLSTPGGQISIIFSSIHSSDFTGDMLQPVGAGGEPPQIPLLPCRPQLKRLLSYFPAAVDPDRAVHRHPLTVHDPRQLRR